MSEQHLKELTNLKDDFPDASKALLFIYPELSECKEFCSKNGRPDVFSRGNKKSSNIILLLNKLQH